ncbi:MAG: DNA polymerase I [Burkholderiales bacterium]
MPDLRSPAGEPTGAIYGVINMLRRLVADYPAEHLACVFDTKGKTFRDVEYEQYKANRPPMPDELVRQIEPLHEAIRALGWPLVAIEGVEADDVIGTLARDAERQGMRCVISTGDKDLAQLVTPVITLVNTMSNEILDEAGVQAKFGVRPNQIVDYLSLTGDTVDNVPGVPKVGPKTAVKWIAQYGSLDAVMANASAISGVVGENLRNTLDWLPKGRWLVTVKCDVELPFTLDQLDPKPREDAKLTELFARFGFKSWLREVSGGEGAGTRSDGMSNAASAIDGRANDSGTAGLAISNLTTDANRNGTTGLAYPKAQAVLTRDYTCISDETELRAWIAKLDAASITSFDTETNGLDPLTAQLVGLSFSVEAGKAAYVPLAHRYAGAPEQIGTARALELLGPWLEDNAKKKLGQNLKFDQHVLANHGVSLNGVEHDTLLQSYVLESHLRHDMDTLAARHLDAKTITYDEVTGKGAQRIGFDQVEVTRATEYAAEDADITLQLHQALYARIATDAPLLYVYEKIEMPVREVLFRMEREGVLIDGALLDAQSHELGAKMLELETRAHREAGQPFNLNSPKQIGEIFFEQLKLPVVKKTPGGAPSTDEEVLEKLALDYPLPKTLLEYRSISKLKSTYTDKLPKMVNARTGRVHTTYGQATAVTGRLASNDPNLQNIPVRTAEGRRIREAFIAPPGAVIVSADYSQIELRIMAHLSEDANLIAAFERGEDIHRATAAEVFNRALHEVTSEERRYAKAINFGLIYGMSAFGLAQQLGIERATAQAYIASYFTRYPGVAKFMQEIRESAKDKGYVETVFGRRLWLPEIKSTNQARRGGAERAAINAPMQGTAADLIKLAMIAVDGWLHGEKLGSKLVMQVHDELVLEVPQDELDRVKKELPEHMTRVASLKVPLIADVGVGPNWETAH